MGIIASIAFFVCVHCDPPTAADPWQDRDRIPKEMVFPPAERERVRRGYPYFDKQFGADAPPAKSWLDRRDERRDDGSDE